MTDQGDRGSVKRFKSSTGNAISAPLRITPTASLPLYQPPEGARVSPTVQSSASLSRTQTGKGVSLKFTVKAPSSKLREATSGTLHDRHDPDDDEQVSSSAAPVGRSVRSTRNPRAVVEQDSDDDDDDEDMDDDLEPELNGEGLDDDEDEDMDEDEDAEGEEDDDEIVSGHPPPPRIQQTTTTQGKPKLKVSAPREGALKSVEAKELEDDDMSEIDSDDEVQNTTALDLDDDDEELDEDDEDDDEGDDMEDGSRSATPDLTKLTRRQRGQFEEEEDPSLLALSNEAQKKKHISAEEHVMRRAEMARRRKNLSEKRNEEEKAETINKLLSKPAPKRRTRAEILAAQANNNGTPGAEGEDGDEPPAHPVYVRWINTASGSTLGVPIEWLRSLAGEALASTDQQTPGGARILVEEVA